MNLIGVLGNVKEKIRENHTSEKLFGAADLCLYSALDIILEYTTLFEECLAVYVSTYTRKQIFNTSDIETVEKKIFRFFFSDLAGKKALIRNMKLNRDLLLLPIALFADCCDAYCSGIVKGSTKMYEIKQALHIRDVSKDLTLPLLHVRQHYKNYLDMREAIVEKYYRLIVSNVGKVSPLVKGKIELEGVASEYYAAAIKAFAKLDIMNGPFTSYLKGWFKNAKSQIFNDEIGVAFLIPNNVRHKIANGNSGVNNFSKSLDEFEEVGVKSEIDVAQESDDIAIRQIVEMFDHSGIYRLLNEIEITKTAML